MIHRVIRITLVVLILVLSLVCSSISFFEKTSLQARIAPVHHGESTEGSSFEAYKTSVLPPSLLDSGYFYAYNVYDPSGAHESGPVTFDTPDDIMILSPGIFPNFCAAADIDENENWYGCDYAGGLYSLDIDTGAQTFIGSTIGVNGMTYDGTTGTWYVTSAGTLYTMDVTTGATTLIASLPWTVGDIICDLNGMMYGEVSDGSSTTLFFINKTTGMMAEVGPMGLEWVFDLGYDRDQATLYVIGSSLSNPETFYTCDIHTGICSPVGSFEGGMEVDALIIPWSFPVDHDIGIQNIVYPISGFVASVTPVVKVKNAGLYTETNVPVQLLIGKELITGTVEDFEATDGGYTHAPKLPQPDAWAWGAPTSGPGAAHSGFNVWATNLAGSYPPSMWCYLVTAPFTVPSGALFNFWHWYYFENNYDGGNVKISTDGGVTWTLITPLGGYPGSLPYNPYMVGEAAYNGQSGGWKQTNFDLSAYEGMLAQIMFETASDSSVQYDGWYIDDVGFTSTSWVNEYTQTATIASIAPEEIVELAFPLWTPSDLGLVENVNINYNAEATALLVGDENINNDYKEKAFNLHYGFFHDVAITQILSPVSGLAQTQTPEVVIENHGQNAETVEVEMTIGKALYTTLLEEDFVGGVPPAGWGTNYPSNWMSSSTNYAGGVSPEAIFSWTPSSVGEHLLYTGNIDTTGYAALALKFKEYVNDYNGDYTLKVVTSTDGGATWSDAYVRAGGPYGPTTTEIMLTAANGIGSATFMIAWDMSGDSFNINYWYIDDVWMGIVDMVEEYNETVSDIVVIPGETMNVSLPDWTPSDITFATTIEYLITANVSLNLPDEEPSDNELAKTITLLFEHDVGVIEITEPVKTGPGEYPVEGIIQNFGVTFSEINIPVNAQFINDTGVIFYNETVIVLGPLAPEAQTIVTFPNVTIPENPGHYYSIKLTMMTQLTNDDHPENNKKTKTWSWGLDIYPPNTTATVSGTMGQNGWYISTVQVTLTATDNKGWPSGVSNTFYKIDSGAWEIYSIPIVSSTDGEHTVYFYSVDNAGNIEEEQNVSFKMDTTAPVFLNYTFIPLNFMKDEWLCSATVEDATSGEMTVEFYVDDVLIFVDGEPPYECLFTGKPTNNSQGLAYDAAGNSAFSPIVLSSEMSSQQQRFLWFSSFFFGLRQPCSNGEISYHRIGSYNLFM